jgi:hypothetical protein
MTDDAARFVALRILEQAVEDATSNKIFLRANRMANQAVDKADALHFFKTAWFGIVAELAGFNQDAVTEYVQRENHKQKRKTL